MTDYLVFGKIQLFLQNINFWVNSPQWGGESEILMGAIVLPGILTIRIRILTSRHKIQRL